MDWHPLCNNDPFPGDAGALTQAARAMASMATKMQEQAALLQGYVADVGHWQGIAKDAFANKVGTIPSQITTAEVRYDVAARALSPYGDALLSSQSSAKQLLAQAQHAQAEIDRHTRNLHDQQQWEKAETHRANLAQSDPTQGSPTPGQWPGANNASLLQGSQSDLNGLRTQLHNLQATFASTASTTAATIKAASEVDKDDNSLTGKLDHLKTDIQHGTKQLVDFLKTHGIDLAEISKALSNIAGALSFLAIFPIPGIQEFLAGAATALALTALVLDTILLVAGEKNLKAWAWEAAGSLLPFAAHGVGALTLVKSAAKESGSVATAVKGSSLMTNLKLVKDAERFTGDMTFMKRLNVAKKFVGVSESSTYSGLARGGLPLAISSAARFGTGAEKAAAKVISLSTRGNSATVIHIIHGAEHIVIGHAVFEKGKGAIDFAHRHFAHLSAGPK
jgi:hypothetical protein